MQHVFRRDLTYAQNLMIMILSSDAYSMILLLCNLTTLFTQMKNLLALLICLFIDMKILRTCDWQR